MTQTGSCHWMNGKSLFIPMFLLFSTTVIAADAPSDSAPAKVEKIKPVLTLSNESSADQDDYCVWVNKENPEMSYIISSDKSANKIFVYDLTGKKVSEIPALEPGNIDVTYDFKLGNELIDLIVVNQRTKPRMLVACTIDKKDGKLTRIDNEELKTDKNYGGCLYHNKQTGKFYFISTSKSEGITQFELYDNNGKLASSEVRKWDLGQTEGAVVNAEKNILYVAEEEEGVWKLGADPEAETPGELIIEIPENGLVGDLEGITLLKISDSESYLIVSDQGASTFRVYREEEGYPFVGNFQIEGAEQSDGIDVITTPLGSKFPHGLFICHTDKLERAGHVVSLDKIINRIKSLETK